MGRLPEDDNFAGMFSEIEDPRGHGVDHPLLSILVLCLCAVICGADGPTAIMDFGNARRDWLEKLVPFPNGIPSHDTIGRVLAMLNPDKLEAAFSGWMKRVVELGEGEVVAIDGKSLRRARRMSSGDSFVHMVSAFASANGVVLAQVKTDDKSNEITAIPRLLELLEIRGCIVTIDAMGCQREIAEQVVAKGADYLLAVKGNQPKLLEAVSEHLEAKTSQARRPADVSFFETKNKGHGRREVRRCWTCPVPKKFDLEENWPGLATLVLIQSERTVGEKRTVVDHWYISSRKGLSGEQALRAKRAHWSIENQLHWVLDVTFSEDQSRLRTENAAENLAVIRHQALNALKSATHIKGSIIGKRRQAAWSTQILDGILRGPEPEVSEIVG